jgi:hypothetical protein
MQILMLCLALQASHVVSKAAKAEAGTMTASQGGHHGMVGIRGGLPKQGGGHPVPMAWWASGKGTIQQAATAGVGAMAGA